MKNEYNYKDPERVACLKRDWAELHPTDQAALLVEWGDETAADFKRDWQKKLRSWGKWLLTAIAGAVAAAAATFGFTSCTDITPEQVQCAHEAYHVLSGKPCPLQEGQCTKYRVQIIK